MKHFFSAIILSLLLFVTTDTLAYTVLIDAGHGGEDTGARGKVLERMKNGKKRWVTVYEKDIALSISKIIYKRLKAKRYKVFLTRSIDRFVGLQDRADIAEQIQADLFISVHLNSSWSKKAHGFESYYLDNHSDVAVKKVEDAENRSWKGEELVIQQILIDLVVERTTKASKQLASKIHLELKERMERVHKMNDRGVKAGLFHVLALSKRPAALLEVGFISNPKELRLMRTTRFQHNFAKSVVEGIDSYMVAKNKHKPALF